MSMQVNFLHDSHVETNENAVVALEGPLVRMPLEIQKKIFSYLPWADALKLQRSCKRMYNTFTAIISYLHPRYVDHIKNSHTFYSHRPAILDIIQNFRFTEASIDSVKEINIQDLDCSTALVSALKKKFSNISKVTTRSFSTDSDVQQIQDHLSDLTDLDLAKYSTISSEGAQYLSRLTKMIHFKMQDCQSLRGNDFHFLFSFRDLETLQLPSCISITDQSLLPLSSLSSLTTLDLSGCEEITDLTLRQLKSLQKLRKINLTRCFNITNLGIECLSFVSSLEHVNLDLCVLINDIGLGYLRFCQKLCSLSVKDNRLITDQGMYYLRNMHSLSHLSISCCPEITDEGCRHISSLTNLKSLDISACQMISDDGLLHFASLGELNKVFFSNCTKITKKGEQFLGSLPKMKVLSRL